MNDLMASGESKMSSKEMAELTEKRHDSVKRTIVNLSQKTLISYPQFVDGIPGANGVAERVYYVGKRDSYVVVAQLSPEFTARLVDRWQELESQVIIAQPVIPRTYPEALRLAADQAETIEQQALALAAAQPAIQMVERFVEAKSSKCLSDVAKILGQKPQSFIKRLNDDGVIFKRSGSWVPYQNQIDNGRFTVKTGESNGHAFHQTRVEPLGIEWLARTYN